MCPPEEMKTYEDLKRFAMMNGKFTLLRSPLVIHWVARHKHGLLRWYLALEFRNLENIDHSLLLNRLLAIDVDSSVFQMVAE